jgi:hypothetical protein
MPLFMRRLGTQLNGPYDVDAYDRNPSEYQLFETEEELLASYGLVDKKAEQEAITAVYTKDNNLAMGDEHKMQSIRNAIAILPPNLFVMYKGKSQPKLADIEAIVGFKVSAKMLQEAMGSDEVIDESTAA